MSEHSSSLRHAIFSKNHQNVLDVLSKCESTEKLANQRDSCKGATALHYAAYIGDPDIATSLIEYGWDPTVTDLAGMTPLMLACARNKPKIVSLLMEMGCSPWTGAKCMQTALHVCAAHNTLQCARRLFMREDYVQNLGRQDENGMTALHIACQKGHADLVDLLLDNGADPDIRDRFGRTCVHLGCFAGSPSIVKLLFRNSADFSVIDNRGRNCVHYTMLSESPDHTSVVKQLQKTTIDLPWAKDHAGLYPFHYAMHTNKVKAAKALLKWVHNLSGTAIHNVCIYAASVDPRSDFFNFFLNAGTTMFEQNPDPCGMSILHYACEWGRADRVEKLLDLVGLSPDEMSMKGVTPLHCAAISGNEVVVQLLLMHEATINLKTNDGHSALHIACSQPFIHIAQLLICNDADVNAIDSQNRTPMMLLANSDCDGSEVVELVDELLDNGALINAVDSFGWSALHYAAAKGNTHVVCGLLERGASASLEDQNGITALHLAAQRPRSTRMATALLKKSEMLLNARDVGGFMAVHYAAMNGNAELTVLLLKKMNTTTVLPNTGPPHQVNPLHLAVMRGKLNVVEAIVTNFQNGPDSHSLFSRDVLLRSPLHYAMKYGYHEMLPFLLTKENCKVFLGWQDKDGQTPLSMAAASGKQMCVRYALELLDELGMTSVTKKISDSQKRCCGMLALTAPGNGALSLVDIDNVDRKDEKGRGFLHRAAYSKKNHVLKLMIEWRPNEICSVDTNGVTPLHVACAVGNIEGLKLMMSPAIGLLMQDKHGATPADWAAAHGKLDIVRFLIKCAGGNSEVFTEISVYLATKNGHANCVRSIIREYPQLARVRDPEGRTLLHLLAARGEMGTLTSLKKCGVDVNAKDNRGRTAAMDAASCSRDRPGMEVLEILIEEGADLKLTDHDQNNALHLACLHGNDEVAKLILSALIDAEEQDVVLNAVNCEKQTVLHLAMRSGMKSFLLELLPLTGHLFWEKDVDGRIPLCASVDDNNLHYSMMLMLGAMLEETTAIDNTSRDVSELESSPRFNRSLTPSKHSSPKPPPRDPSPAEEF